MKGTAAILMILWWIFCMGIALCSTALTIYGIYLSFCASVILGVLVLFFPPASLAFGVIQYFFHTNLPNMILEWLSSHHG